MPKSQYYSAQEVAAELGISVQTVYAYVSRGLLRSEREGTHAHRYLREDVQKLKQRKEQRRNPSSVAAGALHWGTPVLDSAITLISAEQIYYRGQNARDLAQNSSVEQVAALVWTGHTADSARLFADGQTIIPVGSHRDLPLIDQFAAILPLAAVGDSAAFDLRPVALPRTGAKVLHLLTAVATGAERVETTIAQTVADHWCPNDQHATALISAALILCADHELNVSTWTARCVASAGATLYAVVSAGLAALSGVHHGKQTELTALLLADLGGATDLRAALAQKIRLGQSIPGFGHVLYPHGDPRGRLLLDMLQTAYPDHPQLAFAHAVAAAIQALLGEYPNLDFGLAVVERVLGLPSGGGLALFALGRTVGWIGHAIEQAATNKLIRPRARYVGQMPTGEIGARD